MKHIRWMPLLMGLTILAIAGFQFYWLRKAYQREERTLEMRSNFAFRESIHALQASKLKLDKMVPDSPGTARVILRPAEQPNVRMRTPGQKATGIVDVLHETIKDSGRRLQRNFIVAEQLRDTSTTDKRRNRRRERLMQLLYDVEQPGDSVRVREIDSAYRVRVAEQNIAVPFSVHRLASPADEAFNRVTIGFKNPVTYELNLHGTTGFLLGRIAAPIAMSAFLVGFTLLSFLLLYRNLIRQRRLADIKNEFISNITHELKTPIATVSVAIEALRSFNASLDAQKTKEYLDISANELQRLSMLVDKVLKLSMFEKKEVDLKYEPLDMKALVAEVNASMRLQFEKHGAKVDVVEEGNTELHGDRLHLVSVIFNLVDNALKYGNAQPQIRIHIKGNDDKVVLSIADNGIGVPEEYRTRIFEKFFRVPTGNVHNAKGYGLGLSYVAHVVAKHHGAIHVEAATGGGSRFVVTLPKNNA